MRSNRAGFPPVSGHVTPCITWANSYTVKPDGDSKTWDEVCLRVLRRSPRSRLLPDVLASCPTRSQIKRSPKQTSSATCALPGETAKGNRQASALLRSGDCALV